MKINIGLIKGKYDIYQTLDFTNKVKSGSDILEIKPCLVSGILEFEHDQLFANLAIEVVLILASSRSLKPVNYEMKFELDLIFGDSEDADYELSQEILFDEIIYGHILLEKPLSIYLDDELEELEEDTKKVNPAFKGLADWTK